MINFNIAEKKTDDGDDVNHISLTGDEQRNGNVNHMKTGNTAEEERSSRLTSAKSVCFTDTNRINGTVYKYS